MAHRNSLRWHRPLLWIAKGDPKQASKELVTLEDPPGGIIPLRWATSSRYDGRHHSVLVGAIISF
jgi:hypothetical protein